MTGYINFGTNLLSAVTIGSLWDNKRGKVVGTYRK
jgi:hypothetical protein